MSIGNNASSVPEGSITDTKPLIDPRPVSPEARAALLAAAAATRIVHGHREAMLLAAADRRRAVVHAHRHGLSIRRVAAELGVSPGAVQRIVETARSREARGITP